MCTLSACNHCFQFFCHSQGSFLQQYKQHLPAACTAHQRTDCPKQGTPEAIRMTPDSVKTVSFLLVSFPPPSLCSCCMRDTSPLRGALGRGRQTLAIRVSSCPSHPWHWPKSPPELLYSQHIPRAAGAAAETCALHFQELWRVEIQSCRATHS